MAPPPRPSSSSRPPSAPRVSAPPAPEGQGISRRLGPFPLWVWLVGVGGVAIFIYERRKAAASSPTTLAGVTGTTSSLGTGTDIPGLPGATSSVLTLDQWAMNAETYASSHGIDPAMANKAVFDYINQNPLGPKEVAVLEKILTGIGYPPEVLPFLGNVPKKQPAGGGGKKKITPLPTAEVPFVHAANQAIAGLFGKAGLNVTAGTIEAWRAFMFPKGYTSDLQRNLENVTAEEYFAEKILGLKAPSAAQLSSHNVFNARALFGKDYSALTPQEQQSVRQISLAQMFELLNPARFHPAHA